MYCTERQWRIEAYDGRRRTKGQAGRRHQRTEPRLLAMGRRGSDQKNRRATSMDCTERQWRIEAYDGRRRTKGRAGRRHQRREPRLLLATCGCCYGQDGAMTRTDEPRTSTASSASGTEKPMMEDAGQRGRGGAGGTATAREEDNSGSPGCPKDARGTRCWQRLHRGARREGGGWRPVSDCRRRARAVGLLHFSKVVSAWIPWNRVRKRRPTHRK
jgi:hypothetical protein